MSEYRRLSSKIIVIAESHPGVGRWISTHNHYCPACGHLHGYAVDEPFLGGAQWTFNGDAERPSFTKSMKITWGMGGPPAKDKVCHYFVTDGKIIYCKDSTHALAGRTLDLPDIPLATLASMIEIEP